MHLSIRWKFILSIGITLVATYLGLLTWDYLWQRETTSHQMQQIVSELAQSRANFWNTQLSSVEEITTAVANVFERVPPTSPDQIQRTWQANHPPLRGNATMYIVLDPEFAASANLSPAYRLQWNGGGRGGGGGGTLRGGPDSRGPEGRGVPQGRRGRNAQGGRGPGPVEVPLLERVADIDRATEPFYSKAAEERKGVWFEPHLLRNARGPFPGSSATYSVPIMNGDRFLGVVAGLANINSARADVGITGRSPNAGERPPGPPGEFSSAEPPRGPSTAPATVPYLLSTGAVREYTIIGSAGHIISPPNADVSIVGWAKSSNQPALAEDLQTLLEGENAFVHVYRIKDVPELIPEAMAGEHYWVAFAPIAATDWVATAAISEPHYMGPVIARLRDRALFLIGGLFILLLVTALVSIRVSRPIERLAGAVQQLAGGNLDAQVRGVHTRDELGQLAGAFNTMTRQLKAHVAALTEQTAARQNVEAELRIARQIQTDLLPRKFPQRAEVELHALNVPAKRVAGDFYDFFVAPNDLLTVAIADVAGKGMPAALVMAVTRTIIRNLAMEGMSPQQIVERANAMLVQDSADSMFVTLFLCQYDTKTGKIMYVNAGHPRPYLVTAGAAPTQFGQVTGALLGVNPSSASWQFEQQEDQIQPGQTLLLYTDGVTEARAPNGNMLRDAGLEQLISNHAEDNVEQLCVHIVEELNRFQNGQQSDDITLVAMRRK